MDVGLGFLSGLRLKLSRSFGFLGFFSVILPIIPIWTVSLQPQWMREGKVGWQWCLSVRFKSLDHRHPTWTQQFLCQNDKNCLTSENLKIESKEKARSGAELLASPTPSRRRLTDGKPSRVSRLEIAQPSGQKDGREGRNSILCNKIYGF